MNNEVYFAVLEEMNRRFHMKELEYRNKVVATKIANGHKEQLTEDWVMDALLMDYQDDFMTYEQAVHIYVGYCKAVEYVKDNF